jgi:hypothetical protein
MPLVAVQRYLVFESCIKVASRDWAATRHPLPSSFYSLHTEATT